MPLKKKSFPFPTKASSASYEPTVNEVEVPILHRDQCNEWLVQLNVTEGMICAGYAEGNIPHTHTHLLRHGRRSIYASVCVSQVEKMRAKATAVAPCCCSCPAVVGLWSASCRGASNVPAPSCPASMRTCPNTYHGLCRQCRPIQMCQ